MLLKVWVILKKVNALWVFYCPIVLRHVKVSTAFMVTCMCISSKYISIFTLSYQELRSIVDDLKQENKVSNKTKEILSNSTRICTIFIIGRKLKWGKVMFSQVFVCPRWGVAYQHASQVCLIRGGRADPPNRDTWDTTGYVNKQALGILLECILLLMAVNYFFLNHIIHANRFSLCFSILLGPEEWK